MPGRYLYPSGINIMDIHIHSLSYNSIFLSTNGQPKRYKPIRQVKKKFGQHKRNFFHCLEKFFEKGLAKKNTFTPSSSYEDE